MVRWSVRFWQRWCVACALGNQAFKLLAFFLQRIFACKYNGSLLMLLELMQMYASMLSWDTIQFILICDFFTINTFHTLQRVFHVHAGCLGGLSSLLVRRDYVLIKCSMSESRGMTWELSIGLEFTSTHQSRRKQPKSLWRGTRNLWTERLSQRYFLQRNSTGRRSIISSTWQKEAASVSDSQLRKAVTTLFAATAE